MPLTGVAECQAVEFRGLLDILTQLRCVFQRPIAPDLSTHAAWKGTLTVQILYGLVQNLDLTASMHATTRREAIVRLNGADESVEYFDDAGETKPLFVEYLDRS